MRLPCALPGAVDDIVWTRYDGPVRVKGLGLPTQNQFAFGRCVDHTRSPPGRVATVLWHDSAYAAVGWVMFVLDAWCKRW